MFHIPNFVAKGYLLEVYDAFIRHQYQRKTRNQVNQIKDSGKDFGQTRNKGSTNHED